MFMRCSSIDILSMYSCVSRNFTRDRQSCRIYKRRVISPIVCVTEFASWLSANYVLMCSILYAQTICTRRLLSYSLLLSIMQSDFAKYFKLTVCHVITCFHIMCCEQLNRLWVRATISRCCEQHLQDDITTVLLCVYLQSSFI